MIGVYIGEVSFIVKFPNSNHTFSYFLGYMHMQAYSIIFMYCGKNLTRGKGGSIPYAVSCTLPTLRSTGSIMQYASPLAYFNQIH